MNRRKNQGGMAAPESAGGRAAAAGTSLVLSSETGEGALRMCPRRGSKVLFDVNNPTYWMRAGCDAYMCPWCGPRKARAFCDAVDYITQQVDRPRFMTLTNAPEDWQARREAVKDLARRMRKAGYTTEWSWTTEVGKQTGMVHVHAVQHGDYIPQAELQELWGWRVDVRSAVKKGSGVAQYMAKGAGPVVKYMLKSAQEDYLAWAWMNGARPFHTSRGFFLGLGVRGAQQAARAARSDYTPITWAEATPEMVRVYMEAFALPEEEREGFLVASLGLATEALRVVSRGLEAPSPPEQGLLRFDS